jgi:hypothetical protein
MRVFLENFKFLSQELILSQLNPVSILISLSLYYQF